MTDVSANSASQNTGASTGVLSFDQVENYWIQAGGNLQAASMAAAVADASSGLNPNATITNPDGTTAVGLWLIPKNSTPAGSTDPVANARAAIQLSNNGTDWSQWCSTWSDNNCGLDGGTYLGDGSDALGSLAQTTGGSFNVAGAAPTGTGTSASTASTTPPTSTSSSSNSLILIVILVAAAAFVFFMVKRKTGTPGTGSEGSEWTSDQISALQGEDSDTTLAKNLGRSRHAIHVKRSRLKTDSDYTH